MKKKKKKKKGGRKGEQREMLIVTEHLHNGFFYIIPKDSRKFYRYLHKSCYSVNVSSRNKLAASALF